MAHIDSAVRPARQGRLSRGIAALLTATLAVAVIAAGPGAEPAHAAAHTQTKTFTDPAGTRWTAPAGVSRITVEMAGGKGGSQYLFCRLNSCGGRGGLVSFVMVVPDGAELTFYGATAGSDRNGGKGWRTGGRGGDRSGDEAAPGSGGGGAAAIVLDGKVLAVAGGGGGAGGLALTSERKDNWSPPEPVHGGHGGDAGQDGLAGSVWYSSNKPGKGGAGAALPGKSGQNGTPGAWFSWGAGGGGGGGGWESGAGGGSGKHGGSHSNAGGGGGGGSNWVDPRFSGTFGTNPGTDGYVRITYEVPVTLQFAVAPMTEGQQAFARVTAVDNDGTSLLGRHQLTSGGQVLADEETALAFVPLELPAGIHTIEHVFTESGHDPVQATWTVTVAPAGGGIGGLDAVVFDVDMADHVFAAGSSISVAGALVSEGSAVPGLVPVAVAVDGTPAATATTLASGDFALTITGVPVGAHTLTLTSQATPLFLEAPALVIPITVVDERTEVAISSVSSSAVVYGTPIDVVAQVSAADGWGPAPTGFVAIADEDDLIGVATLAADGTATFSGVFPHPHSSSLRALYAGDAVYEAAVSSAWPISVADAATATVLDVASLTGHAGDVTAIQATVSAEAGSVREPSGFVELLVDGEVFASAAIGTDDDAARHDGTVSYAFDTDHLPAGDLELQARFVPGDGYAASASTRVALRLDDHETRLTVTPRAIELAAGAAAVFTGHVEVLGHTGGPLMRQASGAPDAEGVLVAYRGGDVIGSADVDPATGDAELRVEGLPAGSGSLRIVFVPEIVGLADTAATVAYTVTAAPAPVDPAEPTDPTGPTDPSNPVKPAGDTLPATGGSSPVPLLASGVLAVLLGGALIMARRRSALR
ncbi:Ig-like domain repeat protein [Microbacterium sp. zg.Y1090]|uniref:Ig-like domain repeat protein n=1 Tax=Microbacterium TaxID=33882 RepID=UPI00214A8F8F|nr:MULTISPECIES: Ig-like domain repeat protein [unclassified Microbacterium]MCR2814169.1 Ig-like domain repeat protein [Microbacterium sp. zg.Y1084]MCR2819925.1 Ig-like domain repeat protein [Microbacterium sp. zg.Y1090]WIM27513.1 Ig-like domain repeat protein [Microbacterium sp. zg-Y1090]